MKKSEEYGKSRNEAYVKSVAEALSQVPKMRRPGTTVQCASTQRLLSMNSEELAEYRNRPFDLEKAIAPHPDDVARSISPDEFNTFESARRRGKNSIGQSFDSSASDERKELARQAYTCTQPAELTREQIEKLTELQKIAQYEGPVPETKPTIKQKIKNLFKPKTYRMIDIMSNPDEWNIKEKKK